MAITPGKPICLSDCDAALGDGERALEIADAGQEDAQTDQEVHLILLVAQCVGQAQRVLDGSAHFVAVASGEHH